MESNMNKKKEKKIELRKIKRFEIVCLFEK